MSGALMEQPQLSVWANTNAVNSGDEDLLIEEGTAVRVVGLAIPAGGQAAIDQGAVSGNVDAGHSAGDVAEQHGCILGWVDEQTCTVLTFNGDRLDVPREALRKLDVGDPENGGFDVVWPTNVLTETNFGYRVVECLQQRGYCVVQMLMPAKDLGLAVDEAYELTKWQLPNKEFETAYLGQDNTSKYAMLPGSDVGGHGQVANTMPPVLSRCDSCLTEVAMLLEPFAEELGFQPWGRLNGMVRVPLTSRSEERQLRPKPLSDADYQDGHVVRHLDFLERRRLMLAYWLDSEGGEFVLQPHPGSPRAPARLPLVRNRLLLFRSDELAFAYRPRGAGVVLQSWLLAAPSAPDPSAQGVVQLPQALRGERAHVAALMSRYPGKGTDPDAFWGLLAGGLDGLVRVPMGRWDADLYYSADKEEGFTYAMHGGFCSDSVVVMFDNVLFGIPVTEAEQMSPAQRVVLELGYEVLSRDGHNKSGLLGLDCGVFLGDSGSDWAQIVSRSPDPNRCLGMSNCITGSRLSHVLGLRGPCSSADTACSSSLVAVGLAHGALRRCSPEQVRSNTSSHCSRALAVGVSLLLSPRMYILYSGPRMLSPRGRCFTFDSSADGYARGEGCGGVLLRRSGGETGQAHGAQGAQAGASEDEARQMLACLVGTAVNQDGRSASMTAPNGPSQQQCIRTSMSESGIAGGEMAVAECHGTGTALGDPIEVSALRNVMQDRDTPILNTSAKTNLGHLEAAAGMAGFIKCILMMSSSAGPPNVHIRLLNPHMDVNSYPVYFENEISDVGLDSAISGVSSFGFGGTNARADLWGRCVRGARATSELSTTSVFEQRELYYQRIFRYGDPGPHETDRVCICGSWDAYTTTQEMERTELGTYTATVVLGDTRCEQFHFVLNHDYGQTIHPSMNCAGQDADIVGPDARESLSKWLINGRRDLVPAGTIYDVRFEWSFSWERGDHKQVTWKPTGRVGEPSGRSLFSHQYAIVGSWTSWKFQEMVRSRHEEGLWTVCMRVGLLGREEFQLVRDNDWSQTIYPAVPGAKRTSVPVCGPDSSGHGKNWQVRGAHGEIVTVQLRLANGEISVTLASESEGVKTWQSSLDEQLEDYAD